MSTSVRYFLCLCALISTSAFAKTASTSSAYSNITTERCKTLEVNEQEGWSRSRCQGIAGYQLDILEGDLRQSINIISPDGKSHELKFWSTVTNGFSSLGNSVEWRTTKKQPTAMIVRLNASEDPEDSSKTTSYLIVSKIGQNNCVVDVIKPQSKANVKARAVADHAANLPCR